MDRNPSPLLHAMSQAHDSSTLCEVICLFVKFKKVLSSEDVYSPSQDNTSPLHQFVLLAPTITPNLREELIRSLVYVLAIPLHTQDANGYTAEGIARNNLVNCPFLSYSIIKH